MTITLDLPENLLSFVASYGPTPERGAVVVIAVSLYRGGKLSIAAVCRILGFDTPQFEALLKDHGIPLPAEPSGSSTEPEGNR